MTTWTDATYEDLTIDNASFEEAIGSSWTVNQNKTYIDAEWVRHYTQLARTGDYVMRAKFMKAGANYRGSTWFYNVNTYPTTAEGHSYRVTIYAREWLAGGNWTLRLQVSSNGSLSEYTDYEPSDCAGDWTALTHEFTGDAEDYFTITVYCIAADTNTIQYAVVVDDISLTNLTTGATWTADSAGAGTWTAEDAGIGAWVPEQAGSTTWTEDSPPTTTWTED